MNPSSLTASTFTLSAGGAEVAGVVTYDASTNTAAFTPGTNLSPGILYTAEITTGAQSADGEKLPAPFEWTFTTGPTDAIGVIYSFDGTHGADPKGSLTLVQVAGSPMLFGRTPFGGPGWESTNPALCAAASTDPAKCPGGGVIFSLPAEPAAQSTLSAEFDFNGTDGYQPHHDAMVLDGSTLWGAALFSGAISENGGGFGDIYSIDPSNLATSYAVAHAFAGAPIDGANSHSSFAVGTDGITLYGTTAAGAGSSKSKHTGCSSSVAGCGTIYCYDPADAPAAACYDSANSSPYLVLYSFDNGVGKPSSCSHCTGAVPHGRPIVVNGGSAANPVDVLLGMTRQGGYTSGGNSKGNGAIYAYIPSTSAYTVLHLFEGAQNDGAFTDHGNLTLGSFIPAAGGNPAQATVYGMTTNGGAGTRDDSNSGPAPGSGVIFAATVNLPTSGTAPAITDYTILHSFGGTSVKDLVTLAHVPDGYNPYGSLVIDDGWLYGMTRNGGANGGGVIFRMNPATSCAGSTKRHCYGVLASFDSPKDGDQDSTGSEPIDNLTPSADGSLLFGMTQSGGANDPLNHQSEISFGTVFWIYAVP